MKHLFSILLLVLLSSFYPGKQLKTKATSDFELTYTNFTNAMGYSVELHNIGTNQTYNYNITALGGTLGTIPAGDYNITFASTNDMYYRKFSVCSNSAEGNGGASLYYVPMDESCSTLVISWP
jgi:hypothetical protein